MQEVTPTERPSRFEVEEAVGQDIIRVFAEAGGGIPGLRAVAAEVVQPWVVADVWATSILDLILQRVATKVGNVQWPKLPEHTAYFIDQDGDLKTDESKSTLYTPTGYLVTARPAFNILDVRRGYVADVAEQVKAAKKDIIKKLNTAALVLLSAGATQTVPAGVTGLTEVKLNTAFQFAEDAGFRPLWLLMKGSRFNDIRSFVLPAPVGTKLVEKGVQDVVFSGARPILCPEVPSKEVYLICDEKPGRVMDEFPLEVGEPREIEASLQKAVPMFQVVKMAVTNEKRFVRIDCA